MEWARDEKQSRLLLTGRTTGEDWSAAFRLLWEAFARDIVPLNADAQWEGVRVYFWLDSGQVIVFPWLLEGERPIERGHCQVILADVSGEFDRLAESDMSDDAFEARMDELLSAMVPVLLEQAEAANIAGTVGVTPLRISFWKYDSKVVAEHELHAHGL